MNSPPPVLLKSVRILGAIVAAGILFSGCGKSGQADGAGEAVQQHKNVAPHGGTPIALGDDYNLELVRGEAAGDLEAYVLDDEMEEFIRSPDPSITIIAKADGQEQTIALAAVANSATGERVGSTSLFQGHADWLKATGHFEGTLQHLTIRGTAFDNVPFTFPAAGAKD